MLTLLNLINSLIGLAFYLLVLAPIMLFLVYLFAIMGNSFFGGPVWLWFSIMLLLGLAGAKESYDKAKLKEKQKLERD